MSSLFPVVELLASIDGKPPDKFVGRFAWTLNELSQAGREWLHPDRAASASLESLCVPLRRDGVAIETVNEGHKGPFAGHHARYVLRSNVEVLKTVRQGEGRSDAAA